MIILFTEVPVGSLNEKREGKMEASKAHIEYPISSLYPFKQPSQEIVDNTYAFTRTDAYFSVGYHIAPISVLLRPREDKKVLIPGIALDISYPSINMQYILRSELPIVQDGEAPYFVWVGAKLVDPSSQMMRSMDFEPEKAKDIIKDSQKVREMFFNARKGQKPNKEKLEAFFMQFTSSAWYQYYTHKFTDHILQHKEAPCIASEVERTLARVPERMQQAQEAYEKLLKDSDAALLLRNNFRVIFQIKTTCFLEKNLPVVYCSKDIPQILTDPTKVIYQPRNPHEILGFPMGVEADDIEHIFFPDELTDLSLKHVHEAFMNKVEMQGISRQKLRPFSEYKGAVLASCASRYGEFTLTSLREYIENRTLVKVSYY